MKLRRRNPDPTKRTAADRLWRVGDALVVCGALGGAWWLIANHTPNITVPADAAPVKSEQGAGYARLVAAARSVREEGEVGVAISGKQYRNTRFKEGLTAAERDALIEQLAAENAPAIAALREAFKLPIRPAVPAGLTDMDSDLAKVRGAARLFRLQAMVHERRGEYGDAMRANLDALQIGVALQNRAPLLTSLVGIACEAIGRRPMWGLAEKLSADEAREAVRRLEATVPERAPLAEVFEQEKWCMARAMTAEFRTHSLPQTAWRLAPSCGLGGDAPTDSTGARIGIGAVSLLTPKSVILRNFMGYMDAAAATARLPYNPGRTGPAEPRDLVNRILIPVYGGVGHKWRETSAQDGLLIVHLALRAYRAEHDGRWPGSLEELVRAGYLSRVPADPFAPAFDVPLRYAPRTDGAPLLYSIGPDGKDDGGTPLDNKAANGRYRPWSFPESKGDYAVGVNLHSGPY